MLNLDSFASVFKISIHFNEIKTEKAELMNYAVVYAQRRTQSWNLYSENTLLPQDCRSSPPSGSESK